MILERLAQITLYKLDLDTIDCMPLTFITLIRRYGIESIHNANSTYYAMTKCGIEITSPNYDNFIEAVLRCLMNQSTTN